MAKSMIRRPNTFLYAVSGSKTWHTYKLLCLAVVYRHRTHASKTVFSVHFRFVFFSPNFHSLLAGLPSRYKQQMKTAVEPIETQQFNLIIVISGTALTLLTFLMHSCWHDQTVIELSQNKNVLYIEIRESFEEE